MKRWLVCLAVGLLAFGSPAQADIVGLEESILLAALSIEDFVTLLIFSNIS